MFIVQRAFFDALNEEIRLEIERDGKTIYEKACS
ncbi:nucleotidyltransferase [Geobacillus thermocatenulatus]|uniref:Nucleotidyltransferase n=1 Tax=Geobacillus thermocatenulatus TaxID=33938 RepID=A0A226QAU9_9BACL|nr:nucleotidyltransferase [Geobacillus thermocatenulatus]KLR72079.1 nucleotidyltransferase [Geobacillus sp. T6]OXB89703.1 nucleotidyltransferase [Geobacillus thermocatenulatus]RAN22887.1 nucleotidyltransferase [Geobacillus sp. A8]